MDRAMDPQEAMAIIVANAIALRGFNRVTLADEGREFPLTFDHAGFVVWLADALRELHAVMTMEAST